MRTSSSSSQRSLRPRSPRPAPDDLIPFDFTAPITTDVTDANGNRGIVAVQFADTPQDGAYALIVIRVQVRVGEVVVDLHTTTHDGRSMWSQLSGHAPASDANLLVTIPSVSNDKE